MRKNFNKQLPTTNKNMANNLESSKLSSIASKIINPNFKASNSITGSSVLSNQDTKTSKIEQLYSNEKLVPKNILAAIKKSRTAGALILNNLKLSKIHPSVFDVNLAVDGIDFWAMVDTTKVDFSFNQINDISSNDFSVFPSLSNLVFASNCISEIPDNLFYLKMLKLLDFSSNSILAIPETVGYALSLVELRFNSNKIKYIPESIGNLGFLEILNLQNNIISKLPETLGNLSKLKAINLSNNSLMTIPNFIGNLELLQQLELSNNEIAYIEDRSIDRLNNLVYLDLRGNQLDQFFQVPISSKLDTIILAYNKLETIGNIAYASNLTVFDISNNKITVLPSDITSIGSLKTLNLMNNSINDIPAEIGLMKALVRVSMEGNPLKKLPTKVRTSGNTEHLKTYLKTRLPEESIENMNNGLESKGVSSIYSLASFITNGCLKINRLDLVEIPSSIAEYSKVLSKIDLSSNIITEVGIFASGLFLDLTDLVLSKNKIKVFDSLDPYPSLRLIDVSGNLLTEFLDNQKIDINSMKMLRNIEYLDLSRNSINEVPAIIQRLSNLKYLSISQNSISTVSSFWNIKGGLKQLEVLDLSSNRISSLPQYTYNIFPNITTLNVENNELKVVPTDLCLCNSLEKLALVGNPIKQIPYAKLSDGGKNIIDFLRKRHDFSTDMGDDSSNKKKIEILEGGDDYLNCTTLDEVMTNIYKIEEDISDCKSLEKKIELKRKLTELVKLKSKYI